MPKLINKIRSFIRYVLNYNKYYEFFSIRKDCNTFQKNMWHHCKFNFKLDDVGTQVDEFIVTKGFEPNEQR